MSQHQPSPLLQPPPPLQPPDSTTTTTIPGTTTTSNTSSARRQRQRQRIGGDSPYRDDPSSYGPTAAMDNGQDNQGGEKSKEWSLAQRAAHACQSWAYCCYDSCHYPSRNLGRPIIAFPTTGMDADDDLYYYEDTFNDLSWTCSFGTSDEDGIWLNQADAAGTIMAILVWVLMAYSALTMTFLALTGGIPPTAAMAYNIVAALSLASHVKTSLTDPGAVPTAAVPTHEQRVRATTQKLSMCSQCQTFKPPFSHHCRICNRCISRMDHHCPWMNNCVGAGNLKHFLLFLIYTWTCAVFALTLLGWNYFFCADESCVFHIVLLQLVRIMSVLSVATFLFTSSMLMNVIYGILTGVGTIDRLKKKANGTLQESDEEPIPLHHVFGIGPYWQWPLPMDPIFHDYDVVMGYSTPQRLLREQMRADNALLSGSESLVGSVVTRDSYGMPV